MHDRYGQPLWVIGHKLIAIETTGEYAFAEVTVGSKVPGPPPHYHAKADELYYVLDGPVEFMRGDTWHTVQTGESFLIPKGTLHSFRNESDTAKRFITIHDPGAGADALFLGFGIPVDEPNSFERSVSDEVIGNFMAATRENDMIVEVPDPA